MTTNTANRARSGGAPATKLTLWQIITLVFMVGAVGISTYLSYTEGFGAAVACPPNPAFDCGTVQASVYAKVAGIHVAWLGLAFNLVIVGSILLANRIPLLQEFGPVLTTGLLFFGVLFSIWLIYVQAVLLNAYCIWCVLHEVLIFGAFLTSLPTLITHLREEAA
jgi:uncharacterized membrane protein